jgi:hypothetical protein
MLRSFGGINVTVSLNATKRVENWPNKKRSRRLVKKMTKKRGPQITYEPAAFETPFGFVVHPDIYAKMKGGA